MTPPKLHTLFFHLLTVEELRAHRVYWIKIIRAAEAKGNALLVGAATARRQHVENWLFWHRWRWDRRRSFPHQMQSHKRLGRRLSPRTVPEMLAARELEAA